MFCESCGKCISSNMPWVCGYCDYAHQRVKVYSFLNKCKTCKRSPKSYICPHCGLVGFLDRSKNGQNPAHSIGLAIATHPPETIAIRRKQEREEEKFELEHKIMVTRLNGELKTLRRSLKSEKKLPLREQQEKRFLDRKALLVGAHKIARRERARNARLYEDDPDFLALCNDAVQAWLDEEIGL